MSSRVAIHTPEERRDSVSGDLLPQDDANSSTCCAPVFDFLIGRMIQPEDDFRTRTRKLILFAIFFVGIVAFTVLFIPNLVRMVKQGMSLKWTVYLVTHLLVVYPGLTCGYIVMRCRRRHEVPVWGCDLAVLGGATSILVQSLTDPTWPTLPALALLGFVAVLSATRLQNIVLLLLLPVFGMDMWNKSHEIEWYAWNATRNGAEPKLATFPSPEFTIAGSSQRALLHFFAAVMLATILFCSKTYVDQFSEMTLKSTLSARVAKKLAKKMTHYDTQGMGDVLNDFALHEHTDPELVDTFRALLTNLETYRPHLPSYVIAAVEGSSAYGEGNEDIPSPRASVSDGGNEKPDVPPAAPAAASAVEKERPAPVPNNLDTASNSSAIGESAVTRKNLLAKFEWGRKAKVAMAAVSFDLLDASESNVQRFVETAHRFARDTKGVVHSFVRSTLMVSWGTTQAMARPELFALRFFARLTTIVDPTDDATEEEASVTDVGREPDSPGTSAASGLRLRARLSGAACVGPATCRLAGGAQQALVVETKGWAALLDKLCVLAARHRTFVCPAAMAEGVREVRSRWIAAVRVPAPALRSVQHLNVHGGEPGGPPMHVAVAEIRGEVAARADSWAHDLGDSGSGRDKKDPCTVAVAACLRGDMDAARRAFAPPEVGVPVREDDEGLVAMWLRGVCNRTNDVMGFVAACDEEGA